MQAHEIVKLLKERLFSREQKRIQDWIDRLAKQNQQILQLSEPLGFLYNGAYFKPSWLGLGNWPKKPLHESLHGEMEDFLRDLGTLNDDSSFISQSIFMLISSCVSTQDARDALPDCLVQLVPDWKALPRTREAGYTIKANRRAWRDYQRVLPRMEVYSVAQLIY
jgi:hypothetical protein